MIIFQFLKYQLSLKNFLSFLVATKKKKINAKAKAKFLSVIRKKKQQKICVSKC